MIAALQRRKLNMFKWREGMLSPRALVRGNPARVKFAAENKLTCHQTSNISLTKIPNLNVFHLVLQLSLPNLLKPDVESRMKI